MFSIDPLFRLKLRKRYNTLGQVVSREYIFDLL